VERLLRLWDELDELVVYGRFLVSGLPLAGRDPLKKMLHVPTSGGGIPATHAGEVDVRD